MADPKEPPELRRVMADPKEPPEFRAAWVVQVKEMLCNNQSESVVEASPLPRVARPLLNAKPEAYIPQFVSLGPYHHCRLEKDVDSFSGSCVYQYSRLKISTAEAWKVMSAATFSSEIFVEVVKQIEKMRADIESFYDWKIPMNDYSTNFALMMAVDSSFLLNFLLMAAGIKLNKGSSSHGRSSSTDMIDLRQLQVRINCDILKLENQIPLTVLKLVFEILITSQQSVLDQFGEAVDRKLVLERLIDNVQGDVSGEKQLRYFRILLCAAYKEMSPFHMFSVIAFAIKNENGAIKNMEPHLLGYIHAIVSSFLKTGGDGKPEHGLLQRISSWLDKNVLVKLCGIFFCFTTPTPIEEHFPIKGYSARQLARAGVKFKSFSTVFDNIRFDECTHTLYLPRLTIKSTWQTEVFFRNLVAFEFNDSNRGSSVIDYVGLMDCLIDTPDDVRVLMDSVIIHRQSLMLTHEDIANMWDGMCQPFSTGHLEPPGHIKEAIRVAVKKSYYKVKIKMKLIESWDYYYGRYFSRPWKFVALLFGIFLLGLNCVQAYCSLFKCRANN